MDFLWKNLLTKYTKQKNLMVEETIVVAAHINMTAPIGTEQQLFNDDTIVKFP